MRDTPLPAERRPLSRALLFVAVPCKAASSPWLMCLAHARCRRRRGMPGSTCSPSTSYPTGPRGRASSSRASSPRPPSARYPWACASSSSSSQSGAHTERLYLGTWLMRTSANRQRTGDMLTSTDLSGPCPAGGGIASPTTCLTATPRSSVRPLAAASNFARMHGMSGHLLQSVHLVSV